MAQANELRTIAFPAISTGAYGYPLRQAAQVAIGTVQNYPDVDDAFDEILFCCFSTKAHAVYRNLLGE